MALAVRTPGRVSPGSGTSAKVVQLLFSKTNGIGLTILRNRIPFRSSRDRTTINSSTKSDYTYNTTRTDLSLNWDNWDLANQGLISAVRPGKRRGRLTQFSTPWTPRTTARPTGNGRPGRLQLPSGRRQPRSGHYADYADVLADYANGFAANMGIALEPSLYRTSPTLLNYESCSWNSSQIQNFLDAMQQEFQKKASLRHCRCSPRGYELQGGPDPPSLSDAVAGAFLSIVESPVRQEASDFAARWLPTSSRPGRGCG